MTSLSKLHGNKHFQKRGKPTITLLIIIIILEFCPLGPRKHFSQYQSLSTVNQKPELSTCVRNHEEIIF